MCRLAHWRSSPTDSERSSPLRQHGTLSFAQIGTLDQTLTSCWAWVNEGRCCGTAARGVSNARVGRSMRGHEINTIHLRRGRLRPRAGGFLGPGAMDQARAPQALGGLGTPSPGCVSRFLVPERIPERIDRVVFHTGLVLDASLGVDRVDRVRGRLRLSGGFGWSSRPALALPGRRPESGQGPVRIVDTPILCEPRTLG